MKTLVISLLAATAFAQSSRHEILGRYLDTYKPDGQYIYVCPKTVDIVVASDPDCFTMKLAGADSRSRYELKSDVVFCLKNAGTNSNRESLVRVDMSDPLSVLPSARMQATNYVYNQSNTTDVVRTETYTFNASDIRRVLGPKYEGIFQLEKKTILTFSPDGSLAIHWTDKWDRANELQSLSEIRCSYKKP